MFLFLGTVLFVRSLLLKCSADMHLNFLPTQEVIKCYLQTVSPQVIILEYVGLLTQKFEGLG
jgi:hypothetical protein